MSKQTISEIVITAALLILLLLVLNPMNVWMPPAVVMMLLAGIFLSFIVFAVFVWKERSADERENLHKLIAGRIGFLAGSGMLIAGIIVQELHHTVDPWLIYCVVTMVLAKIFSSIYTRMTQ